MPRRSLHWSAHDVATHCILIDGVVHLRPHPEQAIDSQALKRRLVRGLPHVAGGVWRVHVSPDSRKEQPGYPDLVLLHPGGRLVAAECKRDTRDFPTLPQQEWLEYFWAVGAEVYLWYPSDEAQIWAILQGPPVRPRCTQWVTRLGRPVLLRSSPSLS